MKNGWRPVQNIQNYVWFLSRWNEKGYSLELLATEFFFRRLIWMIKICISPTSHLPAMVRFQLMNRCLRFCLSCQWVGLVDFSALLRCFLIERADPLRVWLYLSACLSASIIRAWFCIIICCSRIFLLLKRDCRKRTWSDSKVIHLKMFNDWTKKSKIKTFFVQSLHIFKSITFKSVQFLHIVFLDQLFNIAVDFYCIHFTIVFSWNNSVELL